MAKLHCEAHTSINQILIIGGCHTMRPHTYWMCASKQIKVVTNQQKCVVRLDCFVVAIVNFELWRDAIERIGLFFSFTVWLTWAGIGAISATGIILWSIIINNCHFAWHLFSFYLRSKQRIKWKLQTFNPSLYVSVGVCVVYIYAMKT